MKKFEFLRDAPEWFYGFINEHGKQGYIAYLSLTDEAIEDESELIELANEHKIDKNIYFQLRDYIVNNY